jgi:hypothetical protein
MSGFNLKEFNIISKRHNYFMTNNRISEFPAMKENSLLLRKVLENRTSNSSDKILEKNECKKIKFVKFVKPKNSPSNNIFQSPIIIKTKPNNSNDYSHNDRYKTRLFDNKNNNYINTFAKLSIDKNLIQPVYYKVNIPSKNIINMSPVSSHLGHLSPLCSNYKNNNDSDSDRRILSFKGKKIFTSNSSFGNLNLNLKNLKNDEILQSPNSYRDCSNKGSELFKNIEELKKKKEEIYLRKMKRETSEERREQLRREKDKDIKITKINIDIKNKNIIDNSKNKMRIIPISKKGINTIMKNKNKNNIRINSNDIKNKSIKLSHFNRNKVRDSIDYNKNIIYNFNKNKGNGSKISTFSKVRDSIDYNKNIIFNFNKIKDKGRKINSFSKVRDSIDYNKNIIFDFSKNKDKNPKINSFRKVRDSIDYNKNIIYNFNKNKDSGRKINSFSNISEIIGEEANNLYSKESEEENNNLFSSQKNPKKNIIKIKKNTENSKPKKHANFKIKENIEFLRESQDSKHKSNMNQIKKIDITNKNRDYSPNRFVKPKKKFIEDFNPKNPIIYSKDKKVSIRVNTLTDMNETFLGRKMAKEKLKMQRVISIFFNNNKIELKNIKRKDNIELKKNRKIHNKNSVRFKNLSSIKEEEEKAKPETKPHKIEEEKKSDIKKDNLASDNNNKTRRRYWPRFGTKKQI